MLAEVSTNSTGAAVRSTGGTALAIDEERIPAAATELAREGVLAGPEGALAWAAVHDLVAAGEVRAGQRVVVFQTGHPGNYL